MTTQALIAATELTPLNDRWLGIVRAWLTEVHRRTGSERTPAEYRRAVAHFARQLPAQGRTLAQVAPADAHAFAYAPLPDRWRGGKPGKALAPSSVNVRLAALRSLYDCACRIGVVTVNPVDNVKRPQLPQATSKGLTLGQTCDLLAAVPQTRAGQRDRASILTAVLTGLRRKELIRLTAGAVFLDDDGTPMYTARTKGGKVRYRELPRPAQEAITTYLAADERPLDEDVQIFSIGSQTLYENLRRYARSIG